MPHVDAFVAFARQVWHREYWWAEFFSAAPLLAWALWALVAPDTITERPAFVIARDIMPVRCWELTAALVAVLQLGGLFSDSRWVRAIAAALASWVIFALAVAVWAAVPSSLLVFMLSPAAVNVFALYRHIRRAP